MHPYPHDRQDIIFDGHARVGLHYTQFHLIPMSHTPLKSHTSSPKIGHAFPKLPDDVWCPLAVHQEFSQDMASKFTCPAFTSLIIHFNTSTYILESAADPNIIWTALGYYRDFCVLDSYNSQVQTRHVYCWMRFV